MGTRLAVVQAWPAVVQARLQAWPAVVQARPPWCRRDPP